MAWALVSTIVDQLGSLIASEFTGRLGSLFASEVASIVNVKEEVEKLKLKFQAIQAKLDDAEERQVKEKAVKLWLERLNDIFYEMGDVLDEWNTAKIKADIEKEEEAETSTAKRRKVLSLPNLNYCSVYTVSQRRDVAHKIKEITEKLDEIDREGDMYQFVVLASGNEEVVRPPTDSHVDVSNILGRDKVKGDLVNILLGRGNEEERSPHVISLVGMGGVGKTTLAQLAYNDSELNSAHFEKKGWVCVSEPFNKFMVAKAIIQAFGGDDSNITQWSSLMNKMRETIRGKKLFLVFDDVWTEDFMLWEPFRLALQNAAQGSRILVTTRNNRVAEVMGSAKRINLAELSDDDCWSIFSTIAFSDRDSEQRKDLEEIGRKISDKCKGLPLAARTLGSLMRFKSRKEQWEMVFYSRLWELQDVERGLFAPLLLSYYDLSVLNALEPPPGLEILGIGRYQGTTMFPNWMVSLAKLKRLTLTNGENLKRLPPLGKLQFLEYLLICGASFPFKKVGVEFLGIESENKKDDIIKIFPNLKTLSFDRLRNWEEWIGIGGQEEEDRIIIMPCLQRLLISQCPKIKSLPDFLFKTSLQEFTVVKSPILSKRYRRSTGEDWAKISHIPEIQIDSIQVQRDGQEVIR